MRLSKIVCASLITICTTSILNANETADNLGEITVTGEKLERTLQETMSSVQVFNEKKLEENTNLSDFKEVTSQISNVTSGRWGYTIRGINSYERPTGIGSTNVTLDGAALSFFSINGSMLSTWDLAQAEVLKGPQSTSQGRNSLAGAIVLKTKDPEFEPNGKIRLSHGQKNTNDFALMQTGPITNNLAFRLTAQRKSSDNFTRNESLKEKDFNKTQLSNIRGKLLYLIDDESDILLTIGKTNERDNGNTYLTGTSSSNAKQLWNTDGFYHNVSNTNSLEYKKALNEDWDFKSLTTFTKTDHDRITDNDAQEGNALVLYENSNKDFSQEFRFDYQNDLVNSSIGLFYTSGKKSADSKRNGQDASSIAGGLPLKINYNQQFSEDFSNIALFTNTDYKLTDRLTLITGIRFDKDKRENKSNLDISRITDLEAIGAPSGTNAGVDNQITNLVGPGTAEAENSLSNILPKIGFSYKINENINAGLIFSKGYRPGGISVNPVKGEAKKYDAEFTKNHELSFRSNWLKNRLIANANIFYTKWDEQQIEVQGNSPLQEDRHIENAGESILKGFELETSYQVTDELRLNSNFGYVKTEYKNYMSDGNNYSGKEFAGVPKITANVGFFWKNTQNIFFATDVAYLGKKYSDNENTLEVPAYTVVNSKIGYEQKDWTISLYVNNLFDKKYYQNKTKNDATTFNYQFGDPRLVGVTFEYKW